MQNLLQMLWPVEGTEGSIMLVGPQPAGNQQGEEDVSSSRLTSRMHFYRLLLHHMNADSPLKNCSSKCTLESQSTMPLLCYNTMWWYTQFYSQSCKSTATSVKWAAKCNPCLKMTGLSDSDTHNTHLLWDFTCLLGLLAKRNHHYKLQPCVSFEYMVSWC